MKKIAIIMTMVVALGAVTVVVAQKPGRSFDGDKQSEIGNKMIQARISFDSELSQDEKSVIDEFREKFEAFRESHPRKEKGERNFHDRKQGGDHKAEMGPFNPEEMKPLMEIAKNHKTSLQSIFEEMRPKDKDCPDGNLHKGPRGKHGKRGVVRFLLLDPSKAKTGMTGENLPVFIYPNPAKDVINVQLKNETDQQVKIELFSKSGSLHEVLFESTVQAGAQTYSFKIGHLPANDIYFIKTTNAQGSTVKKLLRN